MSRIHATDLLLGFACLAFLAPLAPRTYAAQEADILRHSGPPFLFEVGRVKPKRAYTPDGQKVVYLADLTTLFVDELYVASVDGSGGSLRLTNLELGETVVDFALSSDGTRVVYMADQDSNEVFELFSVPLYGSAAPVRLHPALDGFLDVNAFLITPDGQEVLFVKDVLGDTRDLLLRVPIDGSAATSLRIALSSA